MSEDDTADVRVEHDVEGQRWTADVDGGEAELAYEPLDDGVLDLQHTIVPPEARNEGVADALVRAAVAHARAEGLKLVATCRYVDAWVRRHRDAADVFVEA